MSKYRVSYTDSASYGGAQSSPSASAKPKLVELYPGYPNPAQRSTTIWCAIPALRGRPSEGTSPNPRVRLSIYDITGRQVTTMVNNRPTKPGYHTVNWNCTDQHNRRQAAGVYFCRLVVVDEQKRTWGNAEALRSTRTQKLVVSR